jgi:hypothetical protein
VEVRGAYRERGDEAIAEAIEQFHLSRQV